MYRKQPIDNPGPVIAADFDDRLDRPIDPVAIATEQQQFNDNLQRARQAQHDQHQIAIRRCTNPACPPDECFCNTSKQFRAQYTPQPGDLGYNPKGPNAHEILDKQKSTKETNPVEQGITLIASPKPTSPICVEELELNALINTNFIRKREHLFHAYSMIMTNYLHYIIQVHVLTFSKHLNGRE